MTGPDAEAAAARESGTLRCLRARFLRDQRAATAVEYAMIASGVGIVVAATVFSLGGALKSNFYDRLASFFG